MLRVLIADDDPICRRMLEHALEKWGYIVSSCDNGEAAWKVLTANETDIAILDWYMPGLTGPEITERHAQLEDARFTYKLILSGQMDKAQVIEALHRGAHDIMEKPCDMRILQSRLSTASRIIKDKRTVEQMAMVMERYATQMELLANERAQQLIHADRMSSLGVLAAGVAHEINNPMSFISGNVQNLERFWKDLDPILRSALLENSPDKQKVSFILEEMPRVFASIMKGVQRVTAIVKGLKKYSGQQGATARTPLNINTCIEQALEMCRGTIGKQVSVELKLNREIEEIVANSIEIEQVLVNLIVNAAHAMEGRELQILTLGSHTEDGNVVVSVEDTGNGIPPELLTKIWDPFITTKPQGKGTGLGLSISSGIIRNHGGSISASNREGGGAKIAFKIPIHEQGEMK